MFMPTQMKGTEWEFVALQFGGWLGLEPPWCHGISPATASDSSGCIRNVNDFKYLGTKQLFPC